MITRYSGLYLTICTAFGFLSCMPASANIWYVKSGSKGDGLTWSTAFGNPQQALKVAQPGDEIWVAAGVYLPTDGTARNQSFQIKRSVQLLGGFAGTETEANQRDPQRNLTSLSGNIGSFDADDNCYHVLSIVDTPGEVLIDGFTIEDGNATGDTHHHRFGGGIYIQQSRNVVGTVILNQLKFRNNLAKDGGALFIEVATTQSAVRMNKCSFTNNEAHLDGGALCLKAAKSAEMLVRMENCSLTANKGNYGSAIFNYALAGHIQLDLLNCRFSNNLAYTDSPEVYWLRPYAKDQAYTGQMP